MSKRIWTRVPRLAALGLMISGLFLNICGQLAEASVDVLPQNVFLILEDGTGARDRLAERLSGAKSFQFAGFMLVFAGPTVWLIYRFLEEKRRIRISRSQRHRGSSIYGS